MIIFLQRSSANSFVSLSRPYWIFFHSTHAHVAPQFSRLTDLNMVRKKRPDNEDQVSFTSHCGQQMNVRMSRLIKRLLAYLMNKIITANGNEIGRWRMRSQKRLPIKQWMQKLWQVAVHAALKQMSVGACSFGITRHWFFIFLIQLTEYLRLRPPSWQLVHSSNGSSNCQACQRACWDSATVTNPSDAVCQCVTGCHVDVLTNSLFRNRRHVWRKHQRCITNGQLQSACFVVLPFCSGVRRSVSRSSHVTHTTTQLLTAIWRKLYQAGRTRQRRTMTSSTGWRSVGDARARARRWHYRQVSEWESCIVLKAF